MANISSSYSLHSEAVNFVRFVTFTKHFLDNSVRKYVPLYLVFLL